MDRPLAVILGAGPGIGLAAARRFAQGGFAVAAVARPGDPLAAFQAALAAQPCLLPVAHIHGGELTEGAMDDNFRHALTKLSHLHFASTATHAQRICQMGEAPDRVFHCGAPGLDHLLDFPWLPDPVLSQRIGLPLEPAPLLATFHPVTLEYPRTAYQAEEFLAALDLAGEPVVFTLPNADTHGRIIAEGIQAFLATHPGSRMVENLGTQAYFSLMRRARAMVGNSSSGLIEAGSFQLPVVNIGNRQRGRTRGAQVIDTADDRTSILAGIRQALTPAFRAALTDQPNPYQAEGPASDLILAKLLSIQPASLIPKHFQDWPPPPGDRRNA